MCSLLLCPRDRVHQCRPRPVRPSCVTRTASLVQLVAVITSLSPSQKQAPVAFELEVISSAKLPPPLSSLAINDHCIVLGQKSAVRAG